MKTQIALFHKTLPISILPLAAAGTAHILQKFCSAIYLLASMWITDQDGPSSVDFERDSSQHKAANSIFPMIMLLFQRFKVFMVSSYESYLLFLVMVMILHLGFYHFKDRIKKSQNQKQSVPVTPLTSKFQDIVCLILCYTLSFYAIKLFLAIILTTSHVSQLQTTTIFPEPNRLFQKLEGAENDFQDFSNRMLVVQQPELLKIVKEVEIPEIAPLNVVFTRDFQIAFEIDLEQSLNVFNISNLTAPEKISSLESVISQSQTTSFVILSSKRGLVFIYGEFIQIINATNLKSPTRINQIRVREENLKLPIARVSPSIAISSDEKYLICSDPEFHIYDISDLQAPKLLFYDDSWRATTVILSADDHTAFIGSLTGLTIWNTTDFSAPKLIGYFPLDGSVLTCAFSKDQRIIYVLTILKDPSTKLTMQKLSTINITNMTDPVQESELSLGEIPNYLGTSLTLSPDGSFLLLQSRQRFIVINPSNSKFSVHSSKTRFSFQNIAFLPDGKNAIIFSTGLFQLAEIYFNIPSDQANSFHPNYTAQLLLDNFPKQMILHPSGKRVFILVGDLGDSNQKTFADIDLSDSSSPSLTQTFDFTSPSKLFALSSDGENIYYKSREKVLQILSTKDKLAKVKSIKFKEDLEPMFVVSSDKKTLFTLYKNDTLTQVPSDDSPCFLFIYDISDSSPQLLSTLPLESVPSFEAFQSQSVYMKLSPDGQTLFLFEFIFYIIDVSNLKAPVLRSNFIIDNLLPKTFVFSSDYKTCFALGNLTFLSRNVLWTIDLTDFDNPGRVERMNLPLDTESWLSISSDDQFLFLGTSQFLLTFNISDQTNLKFANFQVIRTYALLPLPNTQNLLICNADGLHIIGPKPKYVLYSPEYHFKLGKVYSNSLKVLELNNYNYASISENYKFIQASLLDVTYKSLQDFAFTLTFPVFPSWISFDKENAELKLDLTLPRDLTDYQIHSKISTQVQYTDFLDIQEANYTEIEAQDLQAHLIGQGYLDSEQYLTSSFDEYIPLKLNHEYAQFADEIQEKLKSHIIETTAAIFVESSLSIEKSKPFRITSASKNPITVKIKLVPEQAKFVQQEFTDVKDRLDEQKASLLLEGALADINDALGHVLIDLKEDGKPCQGTIIVSDELNPELIENFKDITDYFKINGQPQMQEKHSIQSQINKAPVIIAGQRFNIDFNESTFIDPNNRPLNYSLEMVGENAELPGWITLREQSLSGTPPEAFLPYTKTFIIRASNRFKSKSITFTLNIRLSWVTIASKLMLIISYLFTAYKTWQHSDKFYNILYKKYYRYPVTLKIVPGLEISKKMIFPIALITKEIEGLSKAILNEIKKDLGQGNEKQLIDYLTNDGDLNKERLTKIIEEIVVVQESNNKISEYHKQDSFNKKLISQLIVNELTMKRIKLSHEKMTFGIFEKIKSRWIELVDLNQASDGFLIKNENLASELQAYGIYLDATSQSETTTEYSLDEKAIVDDDTESLSKKIPTKKSIEKELVISSGSKINVGLLKDALLAHAFNCQNLFKNRNNIHIQSKELSNTKNGLWKFLRFDIKSLVSQSTKRLGYGLKYEYFGNQIIFYGELHEQIKNKTMVVQIVSKGGWILREFFIQSPADDIRNEKRSFVESVHTEL